MILRKSGPWATLKYFVNTHRKLTAVYISVALLGGTGLLAAGYFFQAKDTIAIVNVAKQDQTVQTDTTGKITYYSPLSGVQVPDEATTKRGVTAIMIENSPDSRPQSGIKPAGVIYEAVAEGGITRFLTVHQENRPQLVGPVRSLRPYYLDWAAPYDASIAHVGGSLVALQTVRNGSFKDIDQFFNGAYYWRATDRVAPHNVYTSFDKLDELNTKKGYTTSAFNGFLRKTSTPAATPTATKINVAISGPTYNSSYVYDQPNNRYLRSEGGAAHNDREAGQLSPEVVVVIKVPVTLGFEDSWREQMTTNGVGEALVFQDGIAIQGFWRKDGQKSQMYFYDKAGIPIALNPGQTWITAIAPEKSVTWQ